MTSEEKPKRGPGRPPKRGPVPRLSWNDGMRASELVRALVVEIQKENAGKAKVESVDRARADLDWHLDKIVGK